MFARKIAGVGLVLSLAACGGSTEPVADLTGTWFGSGRDNSGPGTLTLVLTQSGSRVSGRASARDAATGLGIEGTVSGSINGDQFEGSMGFSYLNCAVDSDFEARVSETSMTGSYSGSNTCTGPVTNGRFELTRQ